MPRAAQDLPSAPADEPEPAASSQVAVSLAAAAALAVSPTLSLPGEELEMKP